MERYGVGAATATSSSNGGGSGDSNAGRGESFGPVGGRGGGGGRGNGNPNFRWPGTYTHDDGLEDRPSLLKFKKRGPLANAVKLVERTPVDIPPEVVRPPLPPSYLDPVAVVKAENTTENKKQIDQSSSSSASSGVDEVKALEQTPNRVQVSAAAAAGGGEDGSAAVEGVKTKESDGYDDLRRHPGITFYFPEEKPFEKPKGQKKAPPAAKANPPELPPTGTSSQHNSSEAVATTGIAEKPNVVGHPASAIGEMKLLEQNLDKVKFGRVYGVAGGGARRDDKQGGKQSASSKIPDHRHHHHFRQSGTSHHPAPPRAEALFDYSSPFRFCEGTHFYTHPSQTKVPMRPGMFGELDEERNWEQPRASSSSSSPKVVESSAAKEEEENDEYPIGGNPNVVVIREPSTLRFYDY